jgi:hypothetical protein
MLRTSITDQRNNMKTLRSLLGLTRNSTNLQESVAMQNISIATHTHNSTVSTVAIQKSRSSTLSPEDGNGSGSWNSVLWCSLEKRKMHLSSCSGSLVSPPCEAIVPQFAELYLLLYVVHFVQDARF